MKIEAEKKEVIKTEYFRESTIMGCYYPEDDWSVVGYGEALDESLSSTATKMFNENKFILEEDPRDHIQKSKATVLIYTNGDWKLGEGTFEIEDSDHEYIENKLLFENKEHIRLSQFERLKRKKAKEEKEKEQKKKDEEIRRKLYKKLKKEFENEAEGTEHIDPKEKEKGDI